ncbi:efflux RND transporter periplasmic adaptor subunit [Patescibacteria group bacterium]|nr:efflux RND transporter periplasmic adaptor subunit [Patescibacteria group bacterium]MBU4016404.1 efflux RND transporter periplasmic adaptor subunit [Patescibacteria group bacterium]MBU4099291.1 efflux RND transporter periplasmic adaptor subunit [Patescibacteria group bacterium]
MFKKILIKRNIFISLAIFAVFFIGAQIYSSFFKTQVYDIEEVKKTNVTRIVFASGEIKSDDEVELKFPVSGKMTNLAVRKNDIIKKWGYIASLDKKELLKTMDQSLRDYSKERWDFEQDKEVTYKNQLVTDTVKRVLEKNQFDLEKAVLDVELADFAAKNADLYSPIDGVVTKVHTQAGTSVVAGTTPIVTIVNPDNIFFIAKVGESDIANVASGQKVIIDLDAFEKKKFRGKVVQVDYAATVSNGNKAYYVKIQLEEKDKLKLDMSGEAQITTNSRENVIAIPKFTIQEKNGNKYVEVLEKGKVTQREISTGLKGNGGMIEILSGLRVGEKIILSLKKK